MPLHFLICQYFGGMHMSYDIYLSDPVTKEPLLLDATQWDKN